MALTNAEKQKRWRDRRNALAKLAAAAGAEAGKAKPSLKSGDRPRLRGSDAVSAELAAELAQAKGRIRELAAELAEARSRIRELATRVTKGNAAPPLIDENPAPPRRGAYQRPGAMESGFTRKEERDREMREAVSPHKYDKPEVRAAIRAEHRARWAAEDAARAAAKPPLPPHIQRLPPNHDHGLERVAKPAAKPAELPRHKRRWAEPINHKAVPQTKRPRLHRAQ